MALPLTVVLVMGVSGAGKTTVGRRLADELGWDFFDGDDLHPAANVRKMASGVPLDDGDREPWLREIRALVDRRCERGQPAVVACSALKRRYREVLLGGTAGVALVYLRGSREILAERLRERRGHFMPPGLLETQLDALEEPRQALTVDVSPSPAEIVRSLRTELGLEPGRTAVRPYK
jgi:gluconokinase